MSEITYARAIRDALSEEMRRDGDVFLIGEDIGRYGGAFGVTRGMLDEFGPERVRETPIAEQALMGAAVGAALAGMRPVAEIMFSDFLTVCFDQLVNEAAKLRVMFGGKARVPLVVRAAAGSGTGGAAQHSQSLEALMAHIPGLKVAVPSTPRDAKGLLKAAIHDDNPVIFLEQKKLYQTFGEVPDGDYEIPLGLADVKREGADLTFVTYGRTVQMCLGAAEELQKIGIGAEVVDVRTLSPLDSRTILRSLQKTRRCVIVHEAVQFCGFGAEIAAQIAASDVFYQLKAPIRRVGAYSAPVPFNPALETEIGPTEEKLVRAAAGLMHDPRRFEQASFSQHTPGHGVAR